MENSEVSREIPLDVSEHWEREALESGVVFSPRKVGVLRVCAAAEYLAVELLELASLIAELDDFSWAYEGEIEWPEEEDLPLSLV